MPQNSDTLDSIRQADGCLRSREAQEKSQESVFRASFQRVQHVAASNFLGRI